MRLVPERLWMTSGVAEGDTELNAFDNALLGARIGNFNLIKVSSIVPKGAIIEDEGPSIPAGALVPTVLSKAVSSSPGELLASCVGLGLSADSYGIIMEYAGRASAAQAEEIAGRMLEEAFARRGLTLDRVVLRSCQHRVEKVGCTVAAVVLW